MQTKEIIRRLTGNITANGQQSYDDEALDNLSITKEILYPLINELCLNAKDKDDYRSSVNKIANKSIEILMSIKRVIDNNLIAQEDEKKKLKNKLMEYYGINTNDVTAFNLTRVKEAKNYGTLTIDDFEEFDEDVIDDIVKFVYEESDNK